MSAPELSFLAEPDEVRDWRVVLLIDAAAESGLLDALPGRPTDLARQLGLDEQAARVVLDALAAWEVVVPGGDGTVRPGPGAPGEAARAVLHLHARAMRHWASVLDDRLRGVPPDRERPAMRRPDLWLAALAVHAREQAPAVVGVCLSRAPGAATALDLGGGHGEYALELARRGVRVTLQDRPDMIEVIRPDRRLADGGVELFAGDFFEVLPAARYDLVFCSGVTHTYDQEANLALYRRVAGLLAPGGRLAIHTFLRGRHPVSAVFAVQMLANGGGADVHTEQEYTRWLDEAGYAPPEVIDLDDGRRSLLVARVTGSPSAAAV